MSFARFHLLVSACNGILSSGDEIDTVDEMRANRTNHVWRIGRVEYTSLPETFVKLRALRGETFLMSLWFKSAISTSE